MERDVHEAKCMHGILESQPCRECDPRHYYENHDQVVARLRAELGAARADLERAVRTSWRAGRHYGSDFAWKTSLTDADLAAREESEVASILAALSSPPAGGGAS